MTTVYFIRHGQSTANLSQCFAGHIDVKLTDLGRKQATRTAEFLADKHIDAVYSSDLTRAYDTACAIAVKHGLTVQTSQQLREINAGAWEGRRYDDLEETEESYRHWMRDIGTVTCRDGESVVALQSRIADAVAEIVAKHPNESICIVAHGTPIRTMTALWSNTPIELLHTVPWASNASVTVVEFTSPREGKIVAADLHEHLGELSSSLPANV